MLWYQGRSKHYLEIKKGPIKVLVETHEHHENVAIPPRMQDFCYAASTQLRQISTCNQRSLAPTNFIFSRKISQEGHICPLILKIWDSRDGAYKRKPQLFVKIFRKLKHHGQYSIINLLISNISKSFPCYLYYITQIVSVCLSVCSTFSRKP